MDDYAFPGHRYGCSGIDGTTFGPAFGQKDGKQYLYVAYGIYGDINREDNDKMMSLFFSKDGKHIVCGGTTSKIAASYLGKPLEVKMNFDDDDDMPAMGYIEGVDLVTEGVITINRVLEYARDYLKDNESYSQWCYKRDGASLIARMLFEEATDINFFVGRAVNPAHQNPNLPITFSIKMQLVRELSECLKQMGKTIRVSYF